MNKKNICKFLYCPTLRYVVIVVEWQEGHRRAVTRAAEPNHKFRAGFVNACNSYVVSRITS